MGDGGEVGDVGWRWDVELSGCRGGVQTLGRGAGLKLYCSMLSVAAGQGPGKGTEQGALRGAP